MKFTNLIKKKLKKKLPNKIRNLYILQLEFFTIIKCLIFGSSLDLRAHIRWELFHINMRFIFFFKNMVSSNKRVKVNRLIKQDFKRKGIVLLGRDKTDLSQLSEHIETLFLCQPSEKLKELPRKNDQIISNYVFNTLNKFSHKIESILNSHFQTYWISIYKTRPGENMGDSSFAWHQDADPRPLLKVFIYLNEVTKKNGAFRTFDRQISRKLFTKGFISNSPERRIKSQKLITEDVASSSHWIEGPTGTVFIFDNNLIHRATFPLDGYRTVIAIEIYPSKNKIDLINVENSLSMAVIDDFPFNPYLNRYTLAEQQEPY